MASLHAYVWKAFVIVNEKIVKYVLKNTFSCLLFMCYQGPQVPPLSSYHPVAVTRPRQLSHAWPHHFRQRWVAAYINLWPHQLSAFSARLAICLYFFLFFLFCLCLSHHCLLSSPGVLTLSSKPAHGARPSFYVLPCSLTDSHFQGHNNKGCASWVTAV